MPVYEYYCPDNDSHVEVRHAVEVKAHTWGELCALAEIPCGETNPDAPVERLIFAPGVNTPRGDSDLKNLGFSKLVRRDQGVYENVTATNQESRYVKAGDNSTLPDLKSKIRD